MLNYKSAPGRNLCQEDHTPRLRVLLSRLAATRILKCGATTGCVQPRFKSTEGGLQEVATKQAARSIFQQGELIIIYFSSSCARSRSLHVYTQGLMLPMGQLERQVNGM